MNKLPETICCDFTIWPCIHFMCFIVQYVFCSRSRVRCVVYELNSFIWNDRLFRWRYSVTCFCVYAVFVIISVDCLSVNLPRFKLTSSNVLGFRKEMLLNTQCLRSYVTKTVKYSSWFVERPLQTHFTSVFTF